MPDLPKVVHVEDDPDIREIARFAMELVGGLQVVQFPSGPEALAGLDAAAPDLILLDVMMPGMSGEETLAALRTLPRFAATPVVFMTAKAQAAELQSLLDLGAVSVITKPFDPMTLSAQILAAWTRSKAG
jgi:CheY-like chemotaxis protein